MIPFAIGMFLLLAKKVFRNTMLMVVLLGMLSLQAGAQIKNAELYASDYKLPLRDKKGVQQLIRNAQVLMQHNLGDSAMLTLLEALRQSSSLQYRQGLDTALFYLVRYGRQWGNVNTPQAEIAQKAIDYVRALKEQDVRLSWLHDVLAGYFFEKGRYAQGLLEYEKALKALPANKSKNVLEMKSTIYTNMSGAWATLDEEQEALNVLNKAEEIARQQHNIHRQISLLQHRGILYFNNGRLDSAYFYLDSSYSLSNRYPDKHPPGCRCRQYTIANLCMVMIQMHRSDEVLQMVDKEIQAMDQQVTEKIKKGFTQSKLDVLRAFFYYLRAYAYYDKKEYRKAEQILLPLLQQVKEEKIEKNAANIHELLSAVYDATKQYEKAFRHKTQFADLSSGNGMKQEKSKLLALHYSLEKEHALNQKKWLIARQQQEIREKNFWIAGSTIGTLLLVTSLIALYRSNRNKQRLQSASIENLQQQQEITQLQAKVEGEEEERSRIAHELHDGIVSQLLALKLTVDVLQVKQSGTIYPYELNEVALQLDEATQDLRRTAHNLMPDLLLQQGLALSVAALCEKISQNTYLKAFFQAYGHLPSLPQDTELALYRMVQELVQNVLKHAGATQLLVQLSHVDGLLSITVEDNGKGIPVTALQPDSPGTGLRNLKRRVALLKGHIDIKSKKDRQTTIYLEFDLKSLI